MTKLLSFTAIFGPHGEKPLIIAFFIYGQLTTLHFMLFFLLEFLF